MIVDGTQQGHKVLRRVAAQGRVWSRDGRVAGVWITISGGVRVGRVRSYSFLSDLRCPSRPSPSFASGPSNMPAPRPSHSAEAARAAAAQAEFNEKKWVWVPDDKDGYLAGWVVKEEDDVGEVVMAAGGEVSQS